MSRLPPPKSDIGVDLLGFDNLTDSAVSSLHSTPSTGMTPATSSDALFQQSGATKPPPAPDASTPPNRSKSDPEIKLISGASPSPSVGDPRASPSESSMLSSKASSENMVGLTIDDSGSSPAPNNGAYDGSTSIGMEESSKLGKQDPTEDTMHSSNMGFFDRINKEGGGADYKVTFAPGPVGISLDKDAHGRQCLVKSFREVKGPDGKMQDGPAKRSGLIAVGDVITEIDGQSVMELTFKQTMMRLRQVQEKEHTLTFKNHDHIHDLSQYGGDTEIKETKRLIHGQKERWYVAPDETEDMIYCYVERKRGQHVTSFNLHREDTGQYMFSASFDASMTGDLIFHTYPDSHLRKLDHIMKSEDSAHYLGQCTVNAFGTEFTLHDHRATPDKANAPLHELGVVRYEQNILGRVPNFMTCLVPRPEAEHERGEARRVQKKSIADRFDNVKAAAPVEKNIGDHIMDWLLSPFRPDPNKNEGGKDMGIGADAKERRLSAAEIAEDEDDEMDFTGYGGLEQDDHQDLLVFETKKPSWNSRLSAWTLNFAGRVKKASKKNFLLVAKPGYDSFEMEDDNEEPGGKTYLRFGKFNKHRFVMDFRRPLSPMVALSICVSAFRKKMLVT